MSIRPSSQEESDDVEYDMRAAINPPSLHTKGLDYLSECRFALEPSVVGLLDAACAAGWDRSTAALALISLIDESLHDNEIVKACQT